MTNNTKDIAELERTNAKNTQAAYSLYDELLHKLFQSLEDRDDFSAFFHALNAALNIELNKPNQSKATTSKVIETSTTLSIPMPEASDLSVNSIQQSIEQLAINAKNCVESENAMLLLKQLQPHIELAVQLYKNTGESYISTNIKNLKQAVATLSNSGKLIACSQAFEDLGNKHQAFSIHKPSKTLTFLDEQFQSELNKRLKSTRKNTKTSRPLYIRTKKLPLKVSIDKIFNEDTQTSFSIIEIKAPNKPIKINPNFIQTVIHATPAETEVCQHLIFGLSVKVAAEKLERSEHTIRTNIKSLLKKNAMTRQLELITKVLQIVS